MLEGGYKFYRTQVLDNLKTLPEQLRYIIIAGRTGSAKTKLLQTLGSRGAQILDLEGLAHRKGSLLGGCQNLSHRKSCLDPVLLANCQALIKTGRYL